MLFFSKKEHKRKFLKTKKDKNLSLYNSLLHFIRSEIYIKFIFNTYLILPAYF